MDVLPALRHYARQDRQWTKWSETSLTGTLEASISTRLNPHDIIVADILQDDFIPDPVVPVKQASYEFLGVLFCYLLGERVSRNAKCLVSGARRD